MVQAGTCGHPCATNCERRAPNDHPQVRVAARLKVGIIATLIKTDPGRCNDR
jgi:hypothetical protein